MTDPTGVEPEAVERFEETDEVDSESPVEAASPVDDVESHRGLLLAAGLVLWLIVMVPLLVGLAAQHHPRWYPIADLAQTELRVRDVGGPADTFRQRHMRSGVDVPVLPAVRAGMARRVAPGG